jgi:hypothetical protein
MSMELYLGGAALFGAGAAIGGALTLALAKDKISAMTDAAEQANAVVASQSEDALKDLADAYAKAEAMIDVIETAKASTARAEASVSDLIARIHHARGLIERVSRKEWFQPAARQLEPVEVKAAPSPEKRPLLGFIRRWKEEPAAE